MTADDVRDARQPASVHIKDVVTWQIRMYTSFAGMLYLCEQMALLNLKFKI
jgi:hypothetical protein